MAWILGVLAIAAVVIFVVVRPSQTAAPKAPPSEVRLFAQDVASLPLSISIETMGGVSTTLIPRGTALPTARSETFSTSDDQQGSIEVHVVVGDRTLVADNVSVGEFQIVSIPPAPAGVPMFEVSLAVDARGVFRLTAKDRKTGKDQPVSLEAALATPLPPAKVTAMLDAAKIRPSAAAHCSTCSARVGAS